MRTGRFSSYLIILAFALALSGCGHASTAQQAVLSHPVSTLVAATPTVSVKQTPRVVGIPTRLVITTVGINASVESLGTLPNSDMATPTQNPWEDVGWYNQGPRPGERGSAVIDGHLDRPGGYPAVFWRLRDIQVGDDVLVLNTDGKKLHFHVTRIAFYDAQSAPIQDIFGNNGGTYLNLITCAGDWIPSEHQTAQRLVVYTTLM